MFLRFDPFDRFVLVVLGGLLAAILLVVALGDRVGAQVVRVTPADGQTLGAVGRIEIEFSEAMDAATVEPALTVSPATEGDFVWTGNTVRFVPARPFAPGETVEITLASGARSRNGRSVLSSQTWTYTVRQPLIVYLSAGLETPHELWRIDPTTLERLQLTHSDGRIFDFAAAPDGENLVFSVVNDEAGTDLWIVDRDGTQARILLNCGPDLCSGSAWSPDGQRIAFSREPAGLAPGSPKGPPRVWTLSVADGQTAPVYQDTQILGYSPAWSADGAWLGMVDNSTASIRALQIADQRELLLETRQGTMGSFAPDGSRLIYTTLQFDDATAPQPYTTVIVADLGEAGGLTPILGREYSLSDFGTPIWSPLGDWVAINQRTADSGPSKQVWRVRPDGSEAAPITNDPAFTFAGYRWSPWGDALVIQRFPLGTPFATPEIVLWSATDNVVTVLATDASLPDWLP